MASVIVAVAVFTMVVFAAQVVVTADVVMAQAAVVVPDVVARAVVAVVVSDLVTQVVLAAAVVPDPVPYDVAAAGVDVHVVLDTPRDHLDPPDERALLGLQLDLPHQAAAGRG